MKNSIGEVYTQDKIKVKKIEIPYIKEKKQFQNINQRQRI